MKTSCAMTSRLLPGAADETKKRNRSVNRKAPTLPRFRLLKLLLWLGKTCHRLAGRHVLNYGYFGELYAARHFKIELHQNPHQEGSDGRIGNSLVEIKTIAPRDRERKVRVKKAGNFGLLVIVKIDSDFVIDSKLISRKNLFRPEGAHFSVGWEDYPCEYQEIFSTD